MFTHITFYLLHNYGYEISGRVYALSVFVEFGAFYVTVYMAESVSLKVCYTYFNKDKFFEW